jgi:predicted porin
MRSKFQQLALTTVALAASAAASAQTTTTAAPAAPSSTVTIYGVADSFVQFADGANRLTRLQSGGLAGSRLGFRGNEDLGGGLRALFTIESGINLDDGTNGQGAFWGRQAFVGLSSAGVGQLTLGRQYGSLYALSGDFSEFANGVYGPSTAVIGGFGGYEPVRGSANSATANGGPARVNNSARLESASFGGVKVGALWGFGEAAGSTTGTRVADAWVRYTGGPLDAMLSFVDDKVNATGFSVRSISGAAAYSFGAARLTGGYISVDDRSSTNADGQGYWVGGDYRFGQHLVKAQFVENKADNVNAGKTQALGAGYQFDLSRRTAIYTSLTHFKNEGTTYANRWASALPAGLTNADERDVTEFALGVRHSF